MILVNHMRSDNQFHFRMIIEIFEKQIFIRSPRTAGNKSESIVSFELLHQRKVFRLLTYLQYPVETGISHHCYTENANLRQITFGSLVLYKQMVEIFQDIAIGTAIPFKKHLVAAENRRHTIYRNPALVKLIQIILPKLIFDKERHTRISDIKELPHIPGFIKRQVADNIRSPIMLAHLIARRRKESQQYLISRIFCPNHFYQRTPLLKFSQ